jgi:hypothetical protein
MKSGLWMLVLAVPALAQDSIRTEAGVRLLAVPPVIWIDNAVHKALATAWSDSAGQNERAYCAQYSRHPNERSALGQEFHVDSVWIATIESSSPNSVGGIQCPISAGNVVVLHTHPPHTRKIVGRDTTYTAGGEEAYECWPSDIDYSSMMLGPAEFGLIQCARDAITVFYRRPYVLYMPVIIRVPVFLPPTKKPSRVGRLWGWLRQGFR